MVEVAVHDRTATRLGLLLRLVALVAATLIAFVASFVLTLWMVGLVEGVLPGGGAGTPVHGFMLATHVVACGILSAGLIAAVAAALYGHETRPDSRAVSFLAVGIAVAAIAEFALHEWARARFGVFSPDYVGGTVWLPAALLVVSLLGFATLAAPPNARLLLKLTLALAALWVVAILGPNIVGALDGVSAESLPLALAMVAASAFTLFAVVRVWGTH